MIVPGERSFPYPLGVTLVEGGVNAAVYSSVADKVYLSIFDAEGTETRHPLTLADSDIWHGVIPGMGPGQARFMELLRWFVPAAGRLRALSVSGRAWVRFPGRPQIP